MKFRKAHPSDLDTILNVERNAYAYPWTEGNFKDCFSGNYEFWLLELDGDVSGHGVISAAAGEAHLLNICVAKHHQGHGWGRAILRFLVQRARELRVDAMFLEVRDSNVSARALYRSEGYQEIGIRKNYYPSANGREDAHVMSLTLALDCYT